MRILSQQELQAGMVSILQSPKSDGVVALIVRRPRTDEREVMEVAELDCAAGLVGDKWGVRPSSSDQDAQLTIMNARVIAAVAGDKANWPPAGDQLFIDLDLSSDNLPAGTRLAIGPTLIEITAEPHTACSKFAARYGIDAKRFINAPETRDLRLRGVKAKVIEGGQVRVGDGVRRAAQ